MNDNQKMDGLNLGIQNTDVLKNTDVGVLRGKGNYDKSKYTKTTKPDGTVVEEVKMNKKKSDKGLVSVGTDGVNFGQNAVSAGMSKEVSEDVVSFVDSIWGSKQVASKTQDNRKQKLENFKAARDNQLLEESQKRQNLLIEEERQSSRGL